VKVLKFEMGSYYLRYYRITKGWNQYFGYQIMHLAVWTTFFLAKCQ